MLYKDSDVVVVCHRDTPVPLDSWLALRTAAASYRGKTRYGEARTAQVSRLCKFLGVRAAADGLVTLKSRAGKGFGS